MAAIPPSFVYSSGKKIKLPFRIAQTYPFSPIPMGFVPCDARVLAGLPDSALDLFKRSLFTITKNNNISDKSRVTIGQEVIYLFFFTEKMEQNFFFSSKTL